MFGFFKKKSSDRPLTSEEQTEVKDCIRRAYGRLGTPASTESDQVQKLIKEFIDDFHDGGAFPGDDVDAALDIGCLWGQAICRKMKWKWASVKIEGQEIFGIVSPAREYVVFPMVYIQSLLADPNKDRTSLLLYNMIKTGKLPESKENSYLVLS